MNKSSAAEAITQTLETTQPGRTLPIRVVLRLGSVAALLAVLAITLSSAAQAFAVDGTSMKPSLASGQVLLVNRAAYLRVGETPVEQSVASAPSASPHYLFGGPRRGDVVVFQSPVIEDTDFVKRVIGLPGDSVLIEAGAVFVNGEQLHETYVVFPDDYSFPLDGRPVVVPDAAYFVLGDNRGASADSHMGWFVPADNLIGQAFALPQLIA